jgi:RNA polymerase sigma factor (TIGR02999 family)
MTDDPLDPPPITQLLQKWRHGEQDAFDEVIQYVYNDLRRRATAYIRNERDGQSLQATGLVHEAFIKLVDKRAIDWQDRNHFFAIAAQAMRRILVDRVRTKRRDKRGGVHDDLPLDEAQTISADGDAIDLVALDEALSALAVFDERQARIVELKYFGGMTLEETAELLDISPATVKRDWQIARAWLRQQLER